MMKNQPLAKNELIVVGVSHRETPVHVRERFSVSGADNVDVVGKIAALPYIQECVILSTCNRTEVYAVVSNVMAAISEIERFLKAKQQPSGGADNRWFKLLRSDALLHLFRVASGLESMVLGEAQILSQVKNAHQMEVNKEADKSHDKTRDAGKDDAAAKMVVGDSCFEPNALLQYVTNGSCYFVPDL